MAATVADLLDAMKSLNNELEVDDGDRQEARAITALKHSQHWFETLAASYPRILQDTITVNATASTEKTTWDASLLRIDGMQYLDANGNPIGNMYSIQEVGGHVPSLPLPIQLLYTPNVSGEPFAYYGNGRDFYWLPQPSAAASFRVYGFLEADEFDDREDAFDYPNRLILPFAIFATKLMQISVDDEILDLDKLAGQVFRPVIRQLRNFDRSAPGARVYTEFHLT